MGERLQRESFEMLGRGINRSLLGRGSGSGALLLCLGRGRLVKQGALDIFGGGRAAYLERALQWRQVGFFDRLFAPARGDLRRAEVEHGRCADGSAAMIRAGVTQCCASQEWRVKHHIDAFVGAEANDRAFGR